MTGASNDGGEDGPWGIISGETSLENKRDHIRTTRKEKIPDDFGPKRSQQTDTKINLMKSFTKIQMPLQMVH